MEQYESGLQMDVTNPTYPSEQEGIVFYIHHKNQNACQRIGEQAEAVTER